MHKSQPHRSLSSPSPGRLAHGGFLVFLFAFGIGIATSSACKTANEPCDDLCYDAGYQDNTDEIGHADGSLECTCSGLGVGIPQMPCESYCVDSGFTADQASVVGDSCVCAS